MVKRIKWEKLAVENKKCAVLAIFYCGLQSVKSFHISPLDRRDCKDRHNFGICKTKATASGGGFFLYNRFGGDPKIVAAEAKRSPLFPKHLLHFGGDPKIVAAEAKRSPLFPKHLLHFGGDPKIVAAEAKRSPLFPKHLLYFGGDGCPVVAELLVEHLVGADQPKWSRPWITPFSPTSPRRFTGRPEVMP